MNGFEDLMIAEGAVVSGNVRCGNGSRRLS